MPTTQPVQPIQQPILESLKNALQIALFESHPRISGSPGYTKIARLISQAIVDLGEPNLAAMQAGEILLKEWSGTPEPQRQLRDTLAGILHAQLTGVVPKTWERE